MLLGLLLALDLGEPPQVPPPAKGQKAPLTAQDPGFFRPMQPQDMDPRMLEGLEALRKSQPQRSLELFTLALADAPDSARLQGLVGVAHLHLNQCEEGWTWLRPVRAERNFRSSSADKLASCWARQGNYAEAVFWQQESILLEPERALSWALLGLYELRAGDDEAMEMALREADLLDENLLRSAMVRAMRALSVGDVEGVDEQLALMQDLEWPAAVVRASLESRLELDLGNLQRAIELAVEAQPGPRALGELALQAEATRRAGHVEEADWLLSQRDFSDSVVPDLHAVQVRVYADLGRFDQGWAQLDPLLDMNPWDPDLLASAWYLAQAQGRTAQAEHYARRYALVQQSPLRPLEALRPTQ